MALPDGVSIRYFWSPEDPPAPDIENRDYYIADQEFLLGFYDGGWYVINMWDQAMIDARNNKTVAAQLFIQRVNLLRDIL